jgi:type II secretory pathway predicted ATPase ExeA
MYEEHFGLSKNPFQSIAEGEAVFEGPEQKKIIAGLKTALTTKDSVAVVTGPVGVGKTTIVQRALEEAAPDRLVARLGRTAVGSDELVDLLLAQFGVVREPTRRFECLKTFNRILNAHAASGASVFIVIEDAERLGAELLEELEALTASDGGACAGANIILMGPQKLDKLITTPALERLRQRIRLQKTLERFNAEEVETYLRHRIAAAGGNYDSMFETGTALMVRRCSGGIPRVINGLCETALTVTAENQMSQVTPKIVFKVAVEVFGMAPGDAPVAQHTQTVPPAPQPMVPVVKPQPTPAKLAAPATKIPAPEQMPEAKAPEPAAKKPEPAAPKIAPAVPKPPPAVEKPADPTMRVEKIPAEATPEPPQTIAPRAPKPPAKPGAGPAAANGATAPAATPNNEPSRLPDLPGLGVQDKAQEVAEDKPASAKTLPKLPPKFRFADEIVVDRDTKPKLPVQPKNVDPPELPKLEFEDGIPSVVDEQAKETPVSPAAKADDIPTLGDSARVKKVVAEKKKPAPATAKPQPVPSKPKAVAEKAEPAADLPKVSLAEPEPAAIRLDPKINEPTASFAKVDHDMLDAALASLAVHDDEDGPDPEIPPPPVVEANQGPEEIPEVTLDKSIEARRAEAEAATDPAELDRMAAELEQTKTLEEMSDKLAETLFGSEELEAISMQIRENAAPEEESPVALETTEAADAMPTPAPELAKAPAAPEPPSTPKPPPAPATVPAPAANIEISNKPAAASAPSPVNKGPQPEPIENQFNTSMTATLKTLNKRSDPVVDDEEESSGGLLGRLRNTFKS